MWSIRANASKSIAPANWSAALAAHLEVALNLYPQVRASERAVQVGCATKVNGGAIKCIKYKCEYM